MGNKVSVQVTPEGLHGIIDHGKTVVIKTESEEEEEEEKDNSSPKCCCCSKLFACILGIL